MRSSKRLARLVLVAMVLTTASLRVAVGPAAAATFTVNSFADVIDDNQGDGICATTTQAHHRGQHHLGQ